MKKEKEKQEKNPRSRAEELIKRRQQGDMKTDARPYEEVLQELLVHQVELEMQNEELRKAQEIIEESRTRYVDLYDFAPVAYFTFDPGGLIIECNLTACALLGIERRFLTGKPFSSHLLAPYRDLFHKHRLDVLNADSKQTVELMLEKANGTPYFVSIESIAVRTADGPKIRSAVTDVSDRKKAEEGLRKANAELKTALKERHKAEEQLRQSQKMEAIGTLAGGIAHDFNNVLAAIIGNAELAIERVPEGKAHHNLERIFKAGIRGRDLVRQILTFSRKVGWERRPLSLAPLVRDAFSLLRASLPATIEMILDIKTESDALEADPTQIQQVLMNLCSNAADAMREGGALTIGLTDVTFQGDEPLPHEDMRPGTYLVLTVSDTGHGMNDEVRERIFEPFFTTKMAGTGTGMGLALVYGIVKSHEGAITVSSNPEKGSLFSVYLPQIKSDVVRADEKEGPIPIGTERILFVDDEEPLVEMGDEMLSALGYKVKSLTDAMEAFHLITLNPGLFDLVITDQTMPKITGRLLAERIKEIRPDLPIILCTGYNEQMSKEKEEAAGIAGFVMKPFSKREMAETVRRVLDRTQTG